eukprot:2275357-Rhodomonas_salina.1
MRYLDQVLRYGVAQIQTLTLWNMRVDQVLNWMLDAEPKFASMTWVYFLLINSVITLVMFTMFTAVVTSWYALDPRH